VGLVSPAQTVTLSNTGSSVLSISSIIIFYPNLYDFAQTNTCGASVAAGAKCVISVTFAPTDVGSRNASLQISDNGTGSPQTVSLSGTALPPPTPPGNFQIEVKAANGSDVHYMSLGGSVQ